MKYDYLIVGSGLFGSVFAHEANKKNKKCLVIDKRDHLGGNVYCKNVDGINVHKYGCHIFHTNDKGIWNYINQFSDFNNYVAAPIAIYQNEVYNLPFNMNTFSKMWNIKTPQEAQAIINNQIKNLSIDNPKNLEEQALLSVGTEIYEKLIKGYVAKQWNRNPTDLPADIIKRLPVRFTYDNNYFNHRYQGIPIEGYNSIIEKLLYNIDTKTNTDFFDNKEYFLSIADKVLYTGMIDKFYDYKFGQLEYRSLTFKEEYLDIDNYQGNAIVSYTEEDIPFTRIIEHKHFEFGTQPHTVITKEYSEEWTQDKEAYYPIGNKKNIDTYRKYKEISEKEEKVIFGGRLGSYKYYDMDQVIAAALTLSKKELEENEN
jgi:UDP-galactopyranose mutase